MWLKKLDVDVIKQNMTGKNSTKQLQTHLQAHTLNGK